MIVGAQLAIPTPLSRLTDIRLNYGSNSRSCVNMPCKSNEIKMGCEFFIH
jgi:hypothetical protein